MSTTDKPQAEPSSEPGKVVIHNEPSASDANAPQNSPKTSLHTHIIVRDARAALAWYGDALLATPAFQYDEKAAPHRVMYASLTSKYGFSFVVEDDFGAHEQRAAPEGAETAGGCMYFYVMLGEGEGGRLTKCDEVVDRMRERGARVVLEPKDMFYGHRMGRVVDKWGVSWCFAHHLEKEGNGVADGKAGEKKE